MDSLSIDDAVSALMGSDNLNTNEHEAGADDATLEQEHSSLDSPDPDLDIEVTIRKFGPLCGGNAAFVGAKTHEAS